MTDSPPRELLAVWGGIGPRKVAEVEGITAEQFPNSRVSPTYHKDLSHLGGGDRMTTSR